MLKNSDFDNARTTSVALNPSWKLYSASRKLVEVDRRERQALQSLSPASSAGSVNGSNGAAGEARRGSAPVTRRGGGVGEDNGSVVGSTARKVGATTAVGTTTIASAAKGTGFEGWQGVPPPGQHPFSDIIWFS